MINCLAAAWLRARGKERRGGIWFRHADVAEAIDHLRDIDLGIAVGAAVKAVALNRIHCRCQTRIVTAAPELGII